MLCYISTQHFKLVGRWYSLIIFSLAYKAKLVLDSVQADVSFVNVSHEECCAESGATEHMIPDYKAFTSYKSCKNEFVTLSKSIPRLFTSMPDDGVTVF